MRTLLITLTFCALCTSVNAAENPWAAMAKMDLQAIHDTIEANHPGPVDPQNPRFRVWLEDGLKKAMARAEAARSIANYRRALYFYTNGFEDGHIGVSFTEMPVALNWTGFVVYATSDKDAQVVFAENDAGVHKDARLLSCDGKTVDALLKERTDPYYWNAAIPHVRYDLVNVLFEQGADDTRPVLKSCTFSSGSIALKWRIGDTDEVWKKIDSARRPPRKLQMREIDGVWVIGIPTFDFESKAEIGEIQHFVAQIAAKAPLLRQSTLVIDVRGNYGGVNLWGERIAAALWGRIWVDRITRSFDWTTDWRASPRNLARMNERIQYLREIGDTSGSDWTSTVATREAMMKALKEHKPLARDEEPPNPPTGPPPPDPVKGRVYFLADHACGSSCLDFADIMRRLPNVVHIGLPTSADAMYIDVDHKPLPSGLAGLGYGMKVYRHRVRGNNEWYTPKYRWPGGPMTDDRAIVHWIKSLH